MARLNIYSTIVTILFSVIVAIIVAIMILPGLATLAPSPTKNNAKFLEKCKEMVTVECGEEIFDNMIHPNVNGVRLACCYQLLKMGEDCHRALVNEALAAPLPKVNKSEALFNSRTTWRHCFPTAERWLLYYVLYSINNFKQNI